MTARTGAIQLIGGLLLILLLTLVIPNYIKIIPEHLSSKVTQDLKDNGIEWANIDIEDRNITLSGIAPTTDAHNKAVEITQSNVLIRNVQDNILPKKIEPYTLNIQWDNKHLQAEGYFPSDKEKQLFEENISTLYKSNNNHKIKVGAGAPKAWNDLSLSLLKQIRPLELASLNITNKKVTLTGKAVTNKDIQTVKQTLAPFAEQGYEVSVNLLSLEAPLISCKQKFDALLAKEKIRFESGLATISPQSTKLLKALGDTISLCANTKITITGYTDNIGNTNTNLVLSKQRAQAVLSNLFQQGVPLERMKAVGKGSDNPIATNTTAEGQEQNRRIEINMERY